MSANKHRKNDRIRKFLFCRLPRIVTDLNEEHPSLTNHWVPTRLLRDRVLTRFPSITPGITC